MAVSGTYTFDLAVDDILEAAYRKAQIPIQTQEQARIGRQLLNLIFSDWANDQVHIWSLDYLTQALTITVASHTLATSIIDVIEASVRDSDGNDTPMKRLSHAQYMAIVDKDAEGKPSQFVIERTRSGVIMKVWPEPLVSTYTLQMYVVKWADDITLSTQHAGTIRRFYPSLILRLAHDIALENKAKLIMGQDGKIMEVNGSTAEDRAELWQQYPLAFTKAKDEDRDRADLKIYPARW